MSEDQRHIEGVEREIEQTRERMSENIDALGEKLSPENLKRQAKDAIAGKAQDVVFNAGESVRETGYRVFDFIRAHPLPAVAVGLGAVWLLKQRGRGEISRGRSRRARGGFGRLLEENPLAAVAGAAILGLAAGLLVPETERENRLMGSARDLMGKAQTKAQEVSQAVREEVAERGPEIKATLQDAAETVGAEVKKAAARVKHEAKRAARNPGKERGTDAV